MSELKQKLHEMIDELPENKVIYFVRIVADLQSMLVDEDDEDDEDDEVDLALSKQADEALLHGEFESLDGVVMKMGYSLEQLQN